jgi:acetyltransferase-like isoleucine patch superfamily enzyme
MFSQCHCLYRSCWITPILCRKSSPASYSSASCVLPSGGVNSACPACPASCATVTWSHAAGIGEHTPQRKFLHHLQESDQYFMALVTAPEHFHGIVKCHSTLHDPDEASHGHGMEQEAREQEAGNAGQAIAGVRIYIQRYTNMASLIARKCLIIIEKIVYLGIQLCRARAPSHTRNDPVQGILAAGIRYATNHIINHIPSYMVRHAWYQRVLAWEIDASATIMMGQHIYFVSRKRDGRRVSIGADTVIDHDGLISTTGGLLIGEHVFISPGVWLVTGSHDINDAKFAPTYGTIVIDDYAWIGPRATILGRVTVGRGAIVQAGAVVTQDIAPNSVVGGTPAKVIGTRDLQQPSYSLNYRPPFE